MRFGLGSFVYRWAVGRDYYKPKQPMTLEQFIMRSIFLGVEGVMVCNNFKLHEIPISVLHNVRYMLEQRNMFIETGARGSTIDYFLSVLKASQQMGSKLMRLVYDLNRDVSEDEITIQLKNAKICLGEVLNYAKKIGITIAVENYFNMHIDEIKGLLQYFNDEYMGACIDTCNSVSNIEKPEFVFYRLLQFAKSIHFKDYKVELNPRGNIIKGVALGDGVVNFPNLIGLLKQNNYQGNICLELYIDRMETEQETLDYEEQCIKKSIRYAKKIGLLKQ